MHCQWVAPGASEVQGPQSLLDDEDELSQDEDELLSELEVVASQAEDEASAWQDDVSAEPCASALTGCVVSGLWSWGP